MFVWYNKSCLFFFIYLTLVHHSVGFFWSNPVYLTLIPYQGSRGHDHMVVEFTTTYATVLITTNIVWVRIPLRRGVLNTTLCDQVCQWLTVGLWFSLGTPVSSTNKTNCHNITELLVKVALKHPNPNGKITFLFIDWLLFIEKNVEDHLSN